MSYVVAKKCIIVLGLSMRSFEDKSAPIIFYRIHNVCHWLLSIFFGNARESAAAWSTEPVTNQPRPISDCLFDLKRPSASIASKVTINAERHRLRDTWRRNINVKELTSLNSVLSTTKWYVRNRKYQILPCLEFTSGDFNKHATVHPAMIGS